jgi:hypothetical protein
MGDADIAGLGVRRCLLRRVTVMGLILVMQILISFAVTTLLFLSLKGLFHLLLVWYSSDDPEQRTY